MKRPVSLLALAMTLASGQSIADPQYYDSIEAASKIGGQHVTRLQRDSVTRFGELLRFEVRVAWKNPEERPENEAPLRVVRYLARCASKELAVAAVAVFDTSSRVVKNFGVPPGAWDYSSPEPGSPQEEWLASACRMPV